MPAAHKSFQFDSPYPALEAWLNVVRPIAETEQVACSEAHDRVLAEPVYSDRPSPPCSVSAMDGYAVRLSDVVPGRSLAVVGEARIGREPPEIPDLPDTCLRIVTGAPVPAGTDLVIKREDVDESDRGRITLPADCTGFTRGLHLRLQGENAAENTEIVAAGTLISPTVMAALAGFGVSQPRIMARLKIAILTTGDELLPIDAKPSPWQIRDSNGPSLRALVASRRWMSVHQQQHVRDDRTALIELLSRAVSECDAVLLTGGVSMGNYDFVPSAVTEVGGRIVFHKLPIRPGKPILAAVSGNGKPIIGLPGNPVSVLTTATRLALPVLARRAGSFAAATSPQAGLVEVLESQCRQTTIDLWWYRPVRLTRQGGFAMLSSATLTDTKGSGDFASVAVTDGFVEVPPGEPGPGLRRFWPWH